ncbi:MAG: uroporphyrinogen-III synthase [Puniceicoccales bacterium]|nr:uroporphyrinogen-III synthase [Puniceicoccales bacterium]
MSDCQAGIPAAPLSGRRVVVTRPEGQGVAVLRAALEARGAVVLEIPLLEVEYTANPAELGDAWDDMGKFDWLVFTSANGVRGFFERFFETFNDIRALGLARIACVGDATASAVRQYHLNVDFQPADATAAGIASELTQREDIAHLRLLVVTGSRNSDELPRALETVGKAIVQTLAVYAVTENDAGQLDATESFRRHGADAILFASPSAVESFVAQARHLTPGKSARQPKAVAIGPSTAASLREHGIPVAATAANPAPESFADAVVRSLAPAG